MVVGRRSLVVSRWQGALRSTGKYYLVTHELLTPDPDFFFNLDLLESWSYAKIPAKSLSLKDLEVKYLFLNDLAGFFAWRGASAAG